MAAPLIAGMEAAAREGDKMAMNATSIPVASVKTSKLVVDSDLDLTGYTLKANALQVDNVDELTVLGGIDIGLGSGGGIQVSNDLTVYRLTALSATLSPPAPTVGTTKAFNYTQERYTSSTSMVRKMPEVHILRAGNIRVGYQVKDAGGGYHQVAKNGALVDSEVWINNSTYQSITKDVAVAAGDIITIHQRKNVADCYVDDFWIGVANEAQACGLTQLVEPAEASS